MKCGKPANLGQVLVGLHQIGIIGLHDVLKETAESALTDPEEIMDFMIKKLSPENYIPDAQMKEYRRMLVREVRRYRGQDIREFYSEIEVDVRGEAGADRDRFTATLTDVFGDFELKPKITFLPPGGDDPTPELLIGDEPVVRGCASRQQFKAAVRRRISEW
jgi:hypothetical protein